MKKLLLSATVFLSLAVSAQNVIPCGTTEAKEYFLKNLPGYAAQVNAAEQKINSDFEAYLQNMASAKTSSAEATYTIPVVFHILHNGEAVGVGENIPDSYCINALAQVNKDFARLGSDTVSIDPRFDSLYKNINIQFVLAQKDPMGNCTNGIIRHNDVNSNWSQTNLLAFQYSTNAPTSWNPNKYLNIYIVKNIVPSGSVVGGGIIVGYTYKPGTAPVPAADAIVYRNDFLIGLNARSLSHEIGHWLGLSHVFGDTNSPGFECGDDGISDTPPTTGFFSTCPKAGTYSAPAAVANPLDSADILQVSFGNFSGSNPSTILGNMKGGCLKSFSNLNSDTATIVRNVFTMIATNVTAVIDTSVRIATGTVGGYSNFSEVYGVDFNAGKSNTLTVTSSAHYNQDNYVAAYIDWNRDGDFLDAGETILQVTTPLQGVQTYTAAYSIASSAYALYRMRVITSNAAIPNANASITSGEIEDYNLNIGITPTPTTQTNHIMATCDTVRPNLENIMDYSSCPRNFTKGQKDKMRGTIELGAAGRDNLVSLANLQFTGIVDANGNPVSASPCAPVADFSYNKISTCAGQSIKYTNTSYNGTGITLSWEFEGGNPSTSTASVPTVTYSNPGTYSVSLTATNAQGASTKTISTVTINWNAPSRSLPFVEDFESGQWWPTDWYVPTNPNPMSPTWGMANYGAGSSNHSIILPNANMSGYFDGQVDMIELPSFDFSNTTNIGLSFDYTFARKTGVTQDTFKLQYSLDCGGTWSTIPGSPSANTMVAATGGTVNAPYIPWPGTSTWTTAVIPTVGTNMIANKRDVKLRFWFKNDVANGQSQNLYIDNINITGTVGVKEFENNINLLIYPNPTNGIATVDFTTPNNTKANIAVFDVTGRVVEQTQVNTNAGVNTKYQVNASEKLTSGIYFVSISIGNDKVVKKIVIH